jgi:hypothetical protein
MEHQAEALNQGRAPEKKRIMWVALLISALLFGFTGAQLLDIKNSNIETREQSLSGQVLLTEEKLKSLVEDENLTVYWGGDPVLAICTRLMPHQRIKPSFDISRRVKRAQMFYLTLG